MRPSTTRRQYRSLKTSNTRRPQAAVNGSNSNDRFKTCIPLVPSSLERESEMLSKTRRNDGPEPFNAIGLRQRTRPISGSWKEAVRWDGSEVEWDSARSNGPGKRLVACPRLLRHRRPQPLTTTQLS